MRLEIRLLGELDVTVDGRPVVTDLESASTVALLARLAHDPGIRLARPSLAEMLWPDRRPGMALANLRHDLAVLRRVLGDRTREPPLLVGSRDTVALEAGADLWIDLAEFRRLASRPRTTPGAVQAWEQALALRRGPLLAGFHHSLSGEWDTWLSTGRAEADRMWVEVLTRLAEVREHAGLGAEALRLNEQILGIDPYDEDAERRVVALLARSGRPAEAIAHAEGFVRSTRADLGAPVSSELGSLLDDVRRGRLGPSGSAPELPARRAGPVPVPCVAREAQLAQLGRLLDDAVAGAGRIVFVSGSAGSGKSILLRAFADRAAHRAPGMAVLRGTCNAYAGPGDPYLPFRQMLGLLCGELDHAWLHGELTPEQAQALWAEVPRSVEVLLDAGPHLLGSMVDAGALARRVETAFPDHPVSSRLGPAVQSAAWGATTPAARQPVLDEYVRVLGRLAAHRPLLMLIDDLHYADLGTIELTRHLAAAVRDLPILVVAALRPPAAPRGAGPDPLALMIDEVRTASPGCVGPIELVGSRQFVDEWLDTRPNRLDETFRSQLFGATRGHALFTVELVAALLDRGQLVEGPDGRCMVAGPVEWDLVPPRVEALIAARLASLEDKERRDLEVASVQGEAFLAEVVAAVRDVDQVGVAGRMGRLSVAGQPLVEHLGLISVGGRTANRYRFRHRQFQQVLHAGLADQDRVALHRRTAEALREVFAGRVDDIAVDLANHYEEARATWDAVEFHGRAGRRAAALSATPDAVVHLRRALELAAEADPSAQQSDVEVGLLVHLGACLQAVAGYNAPDTTAVYARLRDLLSRLGPSTATAQALGSLATVEGLRGRYLDALASAEKLLEIAGVLGAPPIASAAHSQLGWLCLMRARLTEAEHHLTVAIDTYDPAWDAWLTPALGNHVRSTALAWRAILRWIRGYPDAARRDADEAISEARRVGHPFTLVLILSVAGCVVDEHLRDGNRVIAFADETAAVAQREDFAFYRAAAQLHRGLGLAMTGEPGQGFADVQAGLAAWAALGTSAFRPWIMSAFAEHLVAAGEVDWAERAVSEVDRLLAVGEERLADCFAPVARAAVLRTRGDDERAESVLREGMALLDACGARGPLLRTATALAVLLGDHGRHEEAAAIIGPVLARFDEGLETPDVLAAATALDRARGGS